MAPLHAVTGLNATFAWGPDQQKAFNEVKTALIEATALAQPDSEGEFVLDTDASAVAISGILHQWQGAPGERRTTPTTNHIWQQETDHHPSQIWGTQAGDVCCLLLYPQIPQLPLSPQVHSASRQPSPIMVENLLHRPSIDWTLDYDTGQVSLSRGT